VQETTFLFHLVSELFIFEIRNVGTTRFINQQVL